MRSPATHPPPPPSRPRLAHSLAACAVSVLSHPALADIPLLVLANKSDVPGAASTTEVHDRICRAEGSPLGGAHAGAGTGGVGAAAAAGIGGMPPAAAGGGTALLTSGGAVAPSAGGLQDGTSGGGAATAAGKREYRVFTCSALTAEGVREACDWIVTTSKRHMYAHMGGQS